MIAVCNDSWEERQCVLTGACLCVCYIKTLVRLWCRPNLFDGWNKGLGWAHHIFSVEKCFSTLKMCNFLRKFKLIWAKTMEDQASSDVSCLDWMFMEFQSTPSRRWCSTNPLTTNEVNSLNPVNGRHGFYGRFDLLRPSTESYRRVWMSNLNMLLLLTPHPLVSQGQKRQRASKWRVAGSLNRNQLSVRGCRFEVDGYQWNTED